MKEQVQVNDEMRLRESLLFSEYSFNDVDYDVVFDIIDVDFYYETVTVAITDNGKITQDTYELKCDGNGRYFFEYGRFYEKKIYLDNFELYKEAV